MAGVFALILTPCLVNDKNCMPVYSVLQTKALGVGVSSNIRLPYLVIGRISGVGLTVIVGSLTVGVLQDESDRLVVLVSGHVVIFGTSGEGTGQGHILSC